MPIIRLQLVGKRILGSLMNSVVAALNTPFSTLLLMEESMRSLSRWERVGEEA